MMRFVVCLSAMACAACASSAPEGGVRDNGPMPVSNGLTKQKTPTGRGLGYASSLTDADVGAAVVVPTSLDAAYDVLTKAYLSLGLKVSRDPGAHAVGNGHVVVMRNMMGRRLSAFFNCGMDAVMGSPRADAYQVTFSVMSTLSVVDSARTRVVTLVTGQATDLATSASSVYCSSTGLMESTLLKTAGLQPN